MIDMKQTVRSYAYRALVLAFSLGTALAAAADAPGRLTDLMARGKLEADLGHPQPAIEAFEAVSKDPAVPAALRWEALVRLGMARRQAGDHQGSVRTFQGVATSYAHDPEAIRFLTLAVAGVVPGPERWDTIWKDVRLLVTHGPSGQPSAEIAWPGSASRGNGRSYSGEPISLTLQDADLGDVLRRFSDLTGLEVILAPGEQGKVTMRVAGMPWDEALEKVLQSQGLAYLLNGKVMKVVRPNPR